MERSYYSKRALYQCPALEIMDVDVLQPFAVSHVTSLDTEISVDEWGSSDNEVSFD